MYSLCYDLVSGTQNGRSVARGFGCEDDVGCRGGFVAKRIWHQRRLLRMLPQDRIRPPKLLGLFRYPIRKETQNARYGKVAGKRVQWCDDDNARR